MKIHRKTNMCDRNIIIIMKSLCFQNRRIYPDYYIDITRIFLNK